MSTVKNSITRRIVLVLGGLAVLIWIASTFLLLNPEFSAASIDYYAQSDSGYDVKKVRRFIRNTPFGGRVVDGGQSLRRRLLLQVCMSENLTPSQRNELFEWFDLEYPDDARFMK